MRAARVDRNQAEIVDALRKIGCFVQPLHTVGKGCPDLMVGHSRKWFLLEVKDWAKPPSARKLTKDEEAWHQRASLFAPVHVVETVEQAIAVVTSK